MLRVMERITTFLFAAALALPLPALADDPEVVAVKVDKVGMVWNIHVTIRHEDIGWDHFADGWEVLDAQGNVLGYRQLMHPHVDEQPFTRSLTGVVIPDGTREIFVRPHCSVHGWAAEAKRVELKP